MPSVLERYYKGERKLAIFDQRYLPRWIVVLIDLFLCSFSLLFTWFVLSGLPVTLPEVLPIWAQPPIVLGLNLLLFYLVKTYAGIVRHSTYTDILKLAVAEFITGFLLLALSYIHMALKGEKLFLSTAVILYTSLAFITLLLFRIAVKESYRYIKNGEESGSKRVAIIGVDDKSISLGRALTTDANRAYRLAGFLTERRDMKRVRIFGKRVCLVEDNLASCLDEMDLDSVLLIGDSLSGAEKNKIVEECLRARVEVLNLPSIEQWNSKEDIRNQIQPIQIEDLLERPTIDIEDQAIEKDVKGKTILVTGGAGSIGSELVRQLAGYAPACLVILDQSELGLHQLEHSLSLTHPGLEFVTELADVSNMHRLGLLFEKYRFNTIYHAAAYKHVPLIERNPHEAIYVNVLGTVNLAIQAMSQEVERFVMVSTDKAVNPTNVMGASKRVAEMYVQSLQQQKGVQTKFITTRFGNVLGSSGSVIPRFRDQIANGGPVTVTHPEIIRYFMTIPEACQLVLQAGTMGEGGEIYVFDMGKPVKILSLAEKMIRLSGYEPYVDVDITFTGLRPGEKLFEELLNDGSKVLSTHHPKIMVSSVPCPEFESLRKQIHKLIRVATKKNDSDVVALIKKLVPEYRSNNSQFEKLDEPADQKVSQKQAQ